MQGTTPHKTNKLGAWHWGGKVKERCEGDEGDEKGGHALMDRCDGCDRCNGWMDDNERSQDVDWWCEREDGAKGKHANRKTDQEQATDRRRIEDGQVLVRQVLDGGVGYRRGQCTPPPLRPPSLAVLKSLMLTSLRHSSHRPRGASPSRPPRRSILLVAHCSPPCTKTRKGGGHVDGVCMCVYGCMEADGQRCER